MNRSDYRRPPEAGNTLLLYKVIKTGSLMPIPVAGSPDRRGTGHPVMTGALLAGLVLSKTIFHLRDPLARTNVSHVKFRV